MKPLSQIARAIEYQDTHSLGDVARAIIDGEAQHWKGERSEVVTVIRKMPLMKVCQIWLAGGDMREIVDEMVPSIEVWAKENDCARVEVSGRKGWKRMLKDYREPHVVLIKEI